jgi:hypothetical protein
MLQCNIVSRLVTLPWLESGHGRTDFQPSLFEALMHPGDPSMPNSGPLTGREWIAVAGTLVVLTLWLVLSFTAGAA